MLCTDQDCTYYHWILHANFDLNRKKKYSHVENSRLFNKKRAAIRRLLDEIQQKHRTFTQNVQIEAGSVIIQKETISQDNILIPSDPTSPYAFTLNVANNPQTKKNNDLDQDQTCCVVVVFLVIILSSLITLIICLSQFTQAMTSGMTAH